MAIRTSETAVREITETDSSIRLTEFNAAASALTDFVDTCDTGNVLSATQLRQIEMWLAAHFYAHRDQLLSEEKTADVAGVYQVGNPGEGSLDTTQYGRTAKLLDVTGCLANLDEQSKTGRRTASVTWLGKPVSAQIKYEDRD